MSFKLVLPPGAIAYVKAQQLRAPSRIDHCNAVDRLYPARSKMCQRSASRAAFGKPLAEQGSVRENIAHSAREIAQAHFAF
ncbi:hypothetical protein ACSHT2_30960 [Bradyrhizobium sp. PUT101]|uniref:hypothetical protein n=1 Tax=Bradyrhizobium sp. PUT101 TaxID=3447427 RepID=UPI003F83B950